MKRLITAVAFLMLCTGCKENSEDMDKYTMDYSIEKNRFGVVVAEDGGISQAQAEKYALQRAAEVAHEHGYLYFTIDQESQVTLMRSEKGSPNEGMPTNLYYELIQSDNFGRDRLQTPEMNPSSEISGYQIEFSCHQTKPSGRHYDVCDYGLCN
jgi:hypothetical protein